MVKYVGSLTSEDSLGIQCWIQQHTLFTVIALVFSSPLIGRPLYATLHPAAKGTDTKRKTWLVLKLNTLKKLKRHRCRGRRTCTEGDGLAPAATNGKSNKYTTTAGCMFNVAAPRLQHSHLACDWYLCLHELKCDPTFTVIVVDMSRLHFRAETGFCTQSPILKNTLSYIFQINIGPFLLVCRVHLPETLSELQPYLYTIDLLFLSTRILFSVLV